MKLDNKYLHEIIENFGVDHLIENVKPEDVEEHEIMVIVRTIQTSKEILAEKLKQFAKEPERVVKPAEEIEFQSQEPPKSA